MVNHRHFLPRRRPRVNTKANNNEQWIKFASKKIILDEIGCDPVHARNWNNIKHFFCCTDIITYKYTSQYATPKGCVIIQIVFTIFIMATSSFFCGARSVDEEPPNLINQNSTGNLFNAYIFCSNRAIRHSDVYMEFVILLYEYANISLEIESKGSCVWWLNQNLFWYITHI